MQLDATPPHRGFGTAEEVLSTLLTAEAALTEAPRPSPVHGSVAQWADVVACAQRVVNRAVAVQDEGMVALAAIEVEALDDGTVVESHRAPGHLALDAPAIVSGALSISTVHAENRVRAAVRLAADGPSDTDTATGLGALHEAMAGGRLDSYRAGVLADELEEAPPEVAAAVVQSLESHFESETGPQLRARCRRVLASISPDLLRRRATRAREQCGLRRWAREPGVDQWEGTFPSEDAARAWAAIDARAQQLRADGTCARIERARAQALIDLVTGSATVTTVLTLTVPAAAAECGEPSSTDATLESATGDACTIADEASPSTPTEAVDRLSGNTLPRTGAGAASTETQRGIDTRTSCSTNRTPAVMAPDDLVEVAVSGIAQPVLVTRAFLDVVNAGLEEAAVRRPCHPTSGALLGSAGSATYRPPPAVAALVRQRDGRCRFPGCHVNARFCDLDHVRPWPNGPTDPGNLICLCRRHHRIKQRHGWRVRLAPDGRCTWTDPAGRARTTWAIDALHTLVLPAPRLGPVPTASDDHRTIASAPEHAGDDNEAPDSGSDLNHGSRTLYDFGMSDRHSALEFVLEHQVAAITTAERTRIAALRTVWHPAASAPTRLTRDLHRPHDRHPRADRVVVGAWPRVPGHRTSTHGRRSDLHDEVEEPPF